MILDRNTKLRGKNCSDPTLQLAFDELQSLWRKRFDLPLESQMPRVLDIRFDISSTSEGFTVTTGADELTFRAPNPVEILYAVYDFAESFLDYCFFEPGHDRVEPRNDRVELCDGVLIASRHPLLEHRGFIQEFPFSDDSYRLADWMAKNKLNYLLTWMKYYDNLSPELKEYYRVRGIEIESGHHNFNYWIPPEKYYENHPEFFAVKNGRRIVPKFDKSALLLSEQLCTTNPELRAEIVRNMVAYCRQHPEIKTISLVPNDGFGWCECENCAKLYNPADRGELYSVSEHVAKADRIYQTMVREVVVQLHRQLPEINVTFCAYINYVAPTAGFKLEKNMAVHFAPYWRCINHRINDPDCYTNSHYAADLQKWLAAKAGGKINIYEYYMGVNLYVSLPMIHHEDVFDELAWYGKLGCDGILTQFHLSHWTAYGLNYYMMAKAAWGQNKKNTVATSLQKLFGPDWKLAEKFYAAMKNLVLSTGHCHIPYPYALFSRTELAAYRQIQELAQELLRSAPGDRFRQELLLWTEYLIRFKALFDRYHEGGVREEELEEFRQWLHQLPPSQVFVPANIDALLNAWKKCLQTGREWLHFNLDWEDEYIRRHRTTLA